MKDINAIITRIAAPAGQILSKKYSLDDNQQLVKTTSAQLSKGHAEVLTVKSLNDFASILVGLKPNQALTYGRPQADRVKIVTKDEWAKRGRPDDPIPRTNEKFAYTHSAGVMMKDYDYDPETSKEAFSRDELISIMRKVFSGLLDVAMMWWTSSSSHIFQGDTDITGLKGQRIYILVHDASDIPRAAKSLGEHLWAAGYGYYMVSKSGQLLERCLFDLSVYQPSRLDFAAGAICEPPLEQHRGDPVLIPGEFEFVDTTKAFPEPTDETVAQAQVNRDKARMALKGAAEKTRSYYIEERGSEIAGQDADEKVLEEARETVRRAVENTVLTGSFPLYVCKNGQTLRVTVDDILDEPRSFHGLQTLDPLEPNYDGGRFVGKLYLLQSSPKIFSFAHGNRNFTLLRAVERIQIIRGKLYEAVKQTCSILAGAPNFFDMGDTLVLVEDGESYPLEDHSLKHALGGIIQYYSQTVSSNKVKEQLEDPKPEISRQVLALKSRRKLKPLKAAISVPTICPDGTLLTHPGYDEKVQLLLEFTEPVFVPENPTIEQCLKALEYIWYPFKEFPFCSQLDKTVLITAIITGAVRPALPTSPGIVVEAPDVACGKTLIARSLSVMMTGHEPSVCSISKTNDDDEMRKKLFTFMREGDKVILFDNIKGVLNSASLAAALTSSTFKDRILGKSESSEVPNKALFVLTGNNLTLAGDLPRRMLSMRIDPQTDRAYAREFDLDPVTYVANNRIRIVEAALTLVRGMFTHTKRRSEGRMASFEAWDDLVRQTVCWLNTMSEQLVTGPLADPMDAVDKSQSDDPEREMLYGFLSEWRGMFYDKVLTSKELLNYIRGTDDEELFHAYEHLTGRHGLPTSRSIGWDLRRYKDRIAHGLVLREVPRTNMKAWKVEEIKTQ